MTALYFVKELNHVSMRRKTLTFHVVVLFDQCSERRRGFRHLRPVRGRATGSARFLRGAPNGRSGWSDHRPAGPQELWAEAARTAHLVGGAGRVRRLHPLRRPLQRVQSRSLVPAVMGAAISAIVLFGFCFVVCFFSVCVRVCPRHRRPCGSPVAVATGGRRGIFKQLIILLLGGTGKARKPPRGCHDDGQVALRAAAGLSKRPPTRCRLCSFLFFVAIARFLFLFVFRSTEIGNDGEERKQEAEWSRKIWKRRRRREYTC